MDNKNFKNYLVIAAFAAALIITIMASAGCLNYASEPGNAFYYFPGLVNLLGWSALLIGTALKRNKDQHSKDQ